MDFDVSTRVAGLTGPPFISILLNWGLHGALSVQVYQYWQTFPNDRLRLKILVYGAYLLELSQTILLTHAVWVELKSGNFRALTTFGPTAWIAVCINGSIVAFLVQLFYAYRLKEFSQNIYISCIVMIMSVASLAGAFGTSVDAAQTRSFDQLTTRKSTYPLIEAWLCGGAASDVLIALTMCYYLRKGAKNSPFPSTQRLVSKLIRMTIETGTLTASISVVTVILFVIPSTGIDWEVPLSVTAKLYSTTMLAVLNSRANGSNSGIYDMSRSDVYVKPMVVQLKPQDDAVKDNSSMV